MRSSSSLSRKQTMDETFIPSMIPDHTENLTSSTTPAQTVSQGQTFSIGDLAREFGVTLRTLRFYEDRGLLAPVRDRLTRIYSVRDRNRLALILKGKRLGFTLTEIRSMIAAEERSNTEVLDLNLDMRKVEDQIRHLENQKKEIETALDDLRRRLSRATQ
jgi:DNA-binding transcriptional MerR regulator